MLDSVTPLLKNFGYRNAVILTAETAIDDPRRPRDYRSTDQVWAKLNFAKTNKTIDYAWPTQADGDLCHETTKNQEQAHRLRVWTKEL